MLRHTAFAMTLVLTIFLAVFAAQVSAKTIAKTIQQTDLERMLSLTKGMTNKPPSWRPHVAACHWYNNGQPLCDATGSVTAIYWYYLGLGGSANLTMLPQGLTYLDLYGNNLVGVADLTSLPQGLQSLHLDNNAFSGLLDLTTLPQGLEYLLLFENQFSGSGTFTPNNNWCSYLPTQHNMCGTHDGAFNCSSGVWSCAP